MSRVCQPPHYYKTNETADAARRLLCSFNGLVFRDAPDALNKKNNSGILDDDYGAMYLQVDLRPSLPRRRAKIFLASLEDMAQMLQLEMVSRKYRLTFTKNYKSLMPTDRRAYRLDVLEAAQDGHEALWVNGEKYALGNEVVQDKQRFRTCWYTLLEGLRKVQIELDSSRNQRIECHLCTPVKILTPSEDNSMERNNVACQYCSTNWLSKLGFLLMHFDIVWSSFERNYINELIDIEKKSKKLIMTCIYADDELRQYEHLHSRLKETLIVYPKVSFNEGIKTALSEHIILSHGDFNKDQEKVDKEEEDFKQSKKHQQKLQRCIYRKLPKSETDHSEIKERVCEAYKEFMSYIGLLDTAVNSRRRNNNVNRNDYSFDIFQRAVIIQCKAAAAVANDSNTTNNIKNKDNTVAEEISLSALSLLADHTLIDLKESNAKEANHDIYDKNNNINSRSSSGQTHSIIPWERKLTLEEIYSMDCIARPLINDLKHLREYFQHVLDVPERIDPHLCQNHELVSSLTQLESSWTVAKTHLSSEMKAKRFTHFLKFVSDIVDFDCSLKQASHEIESQKTLQNDLLGENIIAKYFTRDTLEDMILNCDVSAFLCLPRITILYYLCNPEHNSLNAALLKFLLPSRFPSPLNYNEIDNGNECYDNATFSTFGKATIHNEDEQNSSSFIINKPLLPDGVEFFTLLQKMIKINYIEDIPECFCRVIREGAEIADLIDTFYQNKAKSEILIIKERIWTYIIDRAISNNHNATMMTESNTFCLPTDIPNLKLNIDAFYLALEEASIILQRTNPVEWNAFLQTTIKCLDSLRRHRHPVMIRSDNSSTSDGTLMQDDDELQSSDDITLFSDNL